MSGYLDYCCLLLTSNVNMTFLNRELQLTVTPGDTYVGKSQQGSKKTENCLHECTELLQCESDEVAGEFI